MNTPLPANGTADVPWPTIDTRARTPDPAVAAPSASALPPAIGMFQNAVQGAHHTLDRLAEQATPTVQVLGDQMLAAEASLHANAAHLREARQAWMHGARSTVRAHPLLATAAALALGALLARLAR